MTITMWIPVITVIIVILGLVFKDINDFAEKFIDSLRLLSLMDYPKFISKKLTDPRAHIRLYDDLKGIGWLANFIFHNQLNEWKNTKIANQTTEYPIRIAKRLLWFKLFLKKYNVKTLEDYLAMVNCKSKLYEEIKRHMNIQE
jgi:hypothetical protein